MGGGGGSGGVEGGGGADLDLDLEADLKAHRTPGVEHDGVPDDSAHWPAGGGGGGFSLKGGGGGGRVLEPKSPKVCVPKIAKSIFPFFPL